MEKSNEEISLKESSDQPQTPESRTSSLYLYFAALVVNLLAFGAGIGVSWTSPVLPKLTSADLSDNPLGRSITIAEVSWIGGLLNLGAVLGPLFAGRAADKIGRKKCLLLIALPMVASLLLTALATTIIWYYVARLLMGVGVGSMFTVLPIYLGEIAKDHNRGALGTLLGVFYNSGILFSYAVGPFLSIRNFNLVCILPLIVFLPVSAAWIQESAIFLTGNKLRKPRFTNFLESKASRRAFMICLGVGSLQQLAGIRAVFAYMQTIFEIAGSGLQPEISTIIVGIFQVGSTFVTLTFIDRLGRKNLLLVSAVGSFISLFFLGIYLHLKSINYGVSTISWMPLISLSVFIVSFTVGLGPVVAVLVSELFLPKVKLAASAWISVVMWIEGAVVSFSFPMVSSFVGIAPSFWIFALVCAVGAMFINRCVPETQGKSFDEIQVLLEPMKTRTQMS